MWEIYILQIQLSPFSRVASAAALHHRYGQKVKNRRSPRNGPTLLVRGHAVALSISEAKLHFNLRKDSFG